VYELLVYWPGEAAARTTRTAQRAAEVMDLIPLLLAEHDGCERIVVNSGGARLFSIDCQGARQP